MAKISEWRSWLADKLSPGKPQQGEILVDSKLSTMSASYMGNVLDNPDEVLKDNPEGKGYDLYDEMGYKDTKISSALKTRYSGVLSGR